MKLASPGDIWEDIKGSARVSVVDSSGSKKWKTPMEIQPEDQVVLKSDGTPVTMSNDPGRPKKDEDLLDDDSVALEAKPIGELIAAKNERRRRAMKSEPLYKNARKNPDAPEVMDLVLEQLAEEQAAQKFEREELEREGKDISEVSGRRVRVLEKLADAWLRRQERLKNVGVVDLDSPAINEFVRCWTETLVEVMEQLKFRVESRESLLNRLSSCIDDEWKVATRKRMKKAAE